MTPHEIFLWSRLRFWRTAGLRFRRQVPFRSYILDFACHRSSIVIELDGSQHAEPRQARRDADRDRLLTSEGYLVIRVWNGDLQTEPHDTLSHIFDTACGRLPARFRP